MAFRLLVTNLNSFNTRLKRVVFRECNIVQAFEVSNFLEFDRLLVSVKSVVFSSNRTSGSVFIPLIILQLFANAHTFVFIKVQQGCVMSVKQVRAAVNSWTLTSLSLFFLLLK